MDLAVGRERADDARAGSAVPAEIAVLVLRDHRAAVVVDGDRDGALDLADQWMAPLDAAVEDADADAGAGRAAPRPVAGEPVGPGARKRDRCDFLRGEAPGGELLLVHLAQAAGALDAREVAQSSRRGEKTSTSSAPSGPATASCGVSPGIRQASPGPRSRVSPPIVKRSAPSITTPSCSCGWLCIDATAPGSSSITENVTLSPSTTRPTIPSQTWSP